MRFDENSDLFVLDIANNHFGDFEHACNIIKQFGKLQSKTGAKIAIKFQYRNLDTFIQKEYRDRLDLKYIDRFMSTRLTEDELLRLASLVKSNNLLLMTTPFDEASVELALRADVDYIKIASASADDYPLIREISKYNKPVIASTGGLNLASIDKIVTELESKKILFGLMHCVSIYPSPLETLNLRQISMFRDRYPSVNIGWSTHEDPELMEPVTIATSCGATIFERHIGIETPRYLLNKYSSSPDLIEKWINTQQNTKEMLGAYERSPRLEVEKNTLKDLKRGIYFKSSLDAGHKITRDDVYFAIPAVPGQVNPSGLEKSLSLLTPKGKDEPLMIGDFEYDTNDLHYEIEKIIYQVRGVLSLSRTAINPDATMELSHHYGMDRYREFGVFLVTCINREYAKKIGVLLPRQKHPYHFHKFKEETFQLLWGDLRVEVEGITRQLSPGETITVFRGEWHKFQSANGAVFEEVSSTHTIGDSYYEDETISNQKISSRKTEITDWHKYFGFISSFE
jgi:sialic acid synthase SpsE/mannose-6-phosphate isomerase-like protein (cupin superfamily)